MEVSKILLEYNADPNQLDEQLNTPLHACSMLDEKNMIDNGIFKNVKIAEMLIQRGGDLTRENNLGWTVLHFCAKMNNLNLAELIIDKCNKLINMQDIYGQTALYLACKWKSIEVENLLLKKFANKDLPDLSGITPIHLCSFESSTSLLEKLLEYGDDINKVIGNNQKDTPLHIAARSNNSYMINLLINNGADCNKTNGKKQTPLHVAASVGSDQSCLSLLQSGAKINKADSYGQTPFHSCIQAEKNSAKITKLMVDFGSDINKEFDDNMNALALATMSGNINVVKFLIDKKAKIFNSKQESIAHLCALKNQCDSECLKLLIDSYGTEFLFRDSFTSYQTPLQLCVEYKSNQFFKSVISCRNISCNEWFKELYSIKGLGISPLVMAISSQNYEFIEELIKMWLEQFDSTHHAIDFDFFDSDFLAQNQDSYYFSLFSQFKNFFRREKRVSDSSNKKFEKSYLHGCKSCKSQDVCLFKPDWNEKDLRSERYFLNILIRDNEKLTEKVLNTFFKTDILRWVTIVYLDHIEPVENISINNDISTYIRPLSPVETIYIFNKTDLVIHPVIKTLIETKYYDYAQVPFWLDTFRSLGLLAVWTAFSVFENYSIRHYYSGDNKAGKIIILVFVFLFFVWDFIEELRQIYYIFKRLDGYKKWVKKEYENLKQNEKYPDNKNIKLTKKITKYSLIEKETRVIEKLPLPYKRVDNMIDWIALLFQMISLITHLIDIGAHTNSKAEVHIIFSYLTTIFIWFRNLLSVYGAVPGIDLICMLRLIGSQFYRFFFLYIRIIIPFFLIFWTMFSGYQIPQATMQKYWKECESIKYSIPYGSENSLNRSYFSQVCESSISIDGFGNFYDSLFTVFQMIFSNFTDFNDMKALYNEFSPIIISIFLILTNIIGLNFFIGLMSNVLSGGAYKSVESHRSMELLGYVLQHEWRLSSKKRQEHLNKIKNECSPKVLKYNDVIIEKDSEESADPKSNYNSDQDLKTFYHVTKEMSEMRNEIKELKELLKSQLKK
jgi:ankyrin repeat protein